MLKRLSFLVSMPFMGILLILLIVVLALGTFVESSYGRETAYAVVYGTHWFELLLLVMGTNVVGVMIKQKFFKRKKIVIFIFHLAFILILAGAAITRFISYEGNMHIRENATSSSILSSNAYVDISLQANGDELVQSKKVRLTDLTPGDYRMTTRVGGEKVRIKSVGYMSDAIEQYVASPGGDPFLQIVLVTQQQFAVGIPSGNTVESMGTRISLNNPDTTAVLRFVSEGQNILLYAPFAVSVGQMGGKTEEKYEPGAAIPVSRNTLYTVGPMKMAVQTFIPSAKKQLVRAPASQQGNHLGAVKLKIDYKGMITELFVPGLARVKGTPVSGSMGDLSYSIAYGSKEIPIPFSLFLKDFQVERYPGSNSPSSFASDVVLMDPEMGIDEDRRIFMNNVLKHRGFRFYQASYDTDELGTVLSVNKDAAGTFVTYMGYLVLIGGMILALFMRNTRFAKIAKNSATSVKILILGLLILGGNIQLFSQEVPPKEVAEEFGYLWVQDKGGRFEPMNTLANEVVRKITKKTKFEEYTSDQVLLGMILYPNAWQQKPLFKIKNSELQQIIGYKGELVSFNDLMDASGNYILSELVNSAYAKEVASQTDLDKEVIKLDDRLNALYLVRSGGLIRILPDAEAENHKWASVSEAMMGQMKATSDTMSNVFLNYLGALQTGDYMTARLYLSMLHRNQQKTIEVLPTEAKKKLEITYNKINVFSRLSIFYGLVGMLLMVVQFLIVFKPRKLFKWLFFAGAGMLVLAFLVHSFALASRWYISGHAPLSNGYESMIFVSFVTMLAGIIFMKRSGYAVALTAILASLSLMVAGMSNMNPEITNLVPVLKSPWLTIHVTVIMAGYGFLGLASIMGLTNVVFYSFLTTSNKERMQGVIHQLTRVNHLTLIVGLYLMTAGVFLGGVWANESWGRYWGWDPKETWALITVLVYAFVTHMHRIPGLRGIFAFNLGSFISYSSVMMTYFGVNFFLGGIHSYASGSSFKVPIWVYFLVAILVSVSLFAYIRQQKVLPEGAGEDV